MTCAGETVQQQHGRANWVTGFSVEKLEAIDIDGIEMNGHRRSP
jgi:hypothetical protein